MDEGIVQIVEGSERKEVRVLILVVVEDGLVRNGATINVVPSKEKTHASGATMCFFACGDVRGMVAEKLSNKMLNGESYGTPVVSEVIRSDNGEHMLIMHEQGENSNSIVSF